MKIRTGTENRRTRIFFLALFLLLPAFQSVFALGTYDLLRIDPTPRGAALGGHAVAMPDDGLQALSNNPAVLAELKQRSAMIIYGDHQLDMYSGHIAYGQELFNRFWAGSITYFNYGEFDKYTTEYGSPSGEFTAGDYLINIGTGQQLPVKGMSIGANLKFIHSKIDNYSSDGMGLDVGWLWKTGFERLNLGFSLKNIGFQLSKYSDVSESLPVFMHIGASNELEHLPLRLSATLHSESEQVMSSILPGDFEDMHATFSGEFTVSPQLCLRAGYTTYGSDYRVGGSDDNIAGISAGLGVNLDSIAFNYAAYAMGAVGQVHRIGISMDF